MCPPYCPRAARKTWPHLPSICLRKRGREREGEGGRGREREGEGEREREREGEGGRGREGGTKGGRNKEGERF